MTGCSVKRSTYTPGRDPEAGAAIDYSRAATPEPGATMDPKAGW